MSYMRYPVYAWSSGDHMHLWIREDAELDPKEYGANKLLGTESFPDFRAGIQMPQAIFDEIVVGRYESMAKHEPKYLAKIQRKIARDEARSAKLVAKHLAKKAGV